MAKNKKKLIRDKILIPVLVIVVGGVILANIPSVLIFIQNIFHSVFSFLGSEIIIKWWVFILLLLVSLLFILGLITIISLLGRKTELHWSVYTKDVFDGILWEWTIDDNQINGESFSAFCPTCKSRLKYSYEMFNSRYYCTHCEKYCFDKYGTESNILSELGYEIERLIRSGEWKNRIQK